MELTSDSAPRGAFKALARSLAVRVALVPLVGLVVAKSQDNALLGLGVAIALGVAILLGLQMDDRRRRRRAAREHIAGLSQW